MMTRGHNVLLSLSKISLLGVSQDHCKSGDFVVVFVCLFVFVSAKNTQRCLTGVTHLEGRFSHSPLGVTWQQISAKRGPDSRFVVEAISKAL